MKHTSRILAVLLALLLLAGLFPASAMAAGTVTVTALTVPEEGGTVTLSGSNVVNGLNEAQATYSVGASFTVTASAAAGYVFDGWVDVNSHESYTENPLTLAAVSDLTLNAMFSKVGEYGIYSPDLATSPGSHRKGTISVSPTLNSYAQGTTVTFTASPAENYTFEGFEWGYDVDGSVSSVSWTRLSGNTLTMPAGDIWVRGVFRCTAPHTITVVCSQGGTYSISPDGPYYNGDTVTLTAIPDTGCRLKSTSGLPAGFTSSDNVYTIPMSDEDLTIHLEFEELPSVNLTVVSFPSAGGAVTGAQDPVTGKATVTAAPSDGFFFVGWIDYDDQSTVLSRDPAYVFTPERDLTLVGVFQQYLAAPAAGGTVSVRRSDSSGEVTLSAAAASGYDFAGWYWYNEMSGENAAPASTDAVWTFLPPLRTVSDPLAAVFVSAAGHSVYVASNIQHGSVTVAGEKSCYAQGETVTLTAVPDEGWTLDYFAAADMIGGSVQTPVRLDGNSFVMPDNDVAVTAVFARLYAVSVSADPAEGGTVSGGGSYKSGASVTVTATANDGYGFASWTENGSVVSTEASYAFTVSGERTLVAHFESVPTYTVSVSADPAEGGTVSGVGSYKSGASVTVTATANDGYAFASWTENGSVVSTEASYTFTVSGDRTLVAHFEPTSVWEYTTGSGKTTITKYKGAGGDVTIPSELGGAPVTAIGEKAFSSCSTLTSVTVPEGVTSIGAYAFEECAALKSVTLPASLMGVESNAFSICYALESVYISDLTVWCEIDFADAGANPLGWGSGAGKESLLYLNGSLVTDLVIPDTLTAVKPYSFYGCTSITSLTIPEGVTSIGRIAFMECRNLRVVTIPASLTIVQDNAFQNTGGIREVHISDLAAWCDISFPRDSSCPLYEGFGEAGLWLNGEQIHDLVIPEGVTSIGDYAFSECSGLTSVTIPEGVTSIGDAAFSFCAGIPSVTLPDSLTSIGFGAFTCCPDLKTLTFGSGLTSITQYSFYCAGLESVTIPRTVTSIEKNAFFDNDCLMDVYYLGSKAQWDAVEKHEDWNYHCPWEQKVHFMCSVTLTADPTHGGTVTGGGLYETGWIDKSGDSSTAGASVTVTASAASDYAFVNWTENGSVVSTDASYTFTATGDRTLTANFAEIWPYTVSGGKATITGYSGAGGDVTIPSELGGCPVTAIGYNAFKGNTAITSVTIPEGVTSIGETAFEQCTALTGVTIPESVTSIGDGAFMLCTALTSAAIPEGVTSIEAHMFDGCTALASVTIPEGVTSIGHDAFEQCTALTGVTIPDSVTSIEVAAFYLCFSLKDIWFSGTQAQWNEIAKDDYWNENVGMEVGGYTLHYARLDVTLSASPASGGTVSGGGTYDTGASVTVAAAANEGYTFVNWTENGSPVSTDASYTFTATGDRTLTAHFAEIWPYTVSDGKATITGYNGAGGDVTIPSELGGCPVTAIGDTVFNSCTALTGVTIPEGVTSIGGGAFNSCTALTDVTIPNSVTSIEFGAFYMCINLKDVWFSGTQAQWNEIAKGGSWDEYAGDNVGGYTLHYVRLGVTLSASPASGGTVSGGGTYDTGASVTVTATANDNYAFVNWTENGSPVSTDASYTFTATGDRTLTAHFERMTYTVKFVNEDGTELQSGEIAYGETPTYTGATPTKPATAQYTYTFAGWTPEITSVTGAATYTATYTETVNKYTVKFVNEDGTELQSGEIAYGEKPTKPADPTKEGHAFDGWFADEALTKPFDFTAPIEGETAIYPKWTPNDYRLKSVTGATADASHAWTKGSGVNVILTVALDVTPDNSFAHYVRTEIDGSAADASAREGSTIVTIKAAALQKLSVGVHTVTIVFDNGSVDIRLTVKSDPRSPATGDDRTTGLWAALTIVAVMGMGGSALIGKKRRCAGKH